MDEDFFITQDTYAYLHELIAALRKLDEKYPAREVCLDISVLDGGYELTGLGIGYDDNGEYSLKVKSF